MCSLGRYSNPVVKVLVKAMRKLRLSLEHDKAMLELTFPRSHIYLAKEMKWNKSLGDGHRRGSGRKEKTVYD